MAFGLARYDVSERTIRLELEEVSPDPEHPITLIVRHAGPANRHWTSAMFRHPPPGPPAEPPKPADEQAERARAAGENDRLATLCAEAVVVGWENVFDDAAPGVPVPFSVDAARLFLLELMTHVPDVWQRVFIAFTDKPRFRAAAGAVDPVDLGKG